MLVTCQLKTLTFSMHASPRRLPRKCSASAFLFGERLHAFTTRVIHFRNVWFLHCWISEKNSTTRGLTLIHFRNVWFLPCWISDSLRCGASRVPSLMTLRVHKSSTCSGYTSNPKIRQKSGSCGRVGSVGCWKLRALGGWFVSNLCTFKKDLRQEQKINFLMTRRYGAIMFLA